MNFELNKPYPDIKVNKKNLKHANILLESFAGTISEDTATHEYIYQHIILKKINKNLSDALLKISITEMKHLSFLGELIQLLGMNPEYKSYNYFTNNYTYWSGNYINYETNIKTLLLHNIKMEEMAIKQYKKTITLIKDENIISLINRIIEDENLHIQIFKYFLSN